ncbi:MAG: helix-turn-helix domain-containing protein [Cyclobacteriaceae bacterium]|jgi:transcriptional regulator with XRE-family HTH domain|nr:helix-turn-helix domain-containing protein [Cyclobacteriaceae bacterium]
MKSLGETLRSLREARGLLIREVASALDIDPSLLSRIERGVKRPTRSQVLTLAKILGADEHELLVAYLSDKVVYELEGEELALKAMRAAEKRLTYSRARSRKPGKGK